MARHRSQNGMVRKYKKYHEDKRCTAYLPALMGFCSVVSWDGAKSSLVIRLDAVSNAAQLQPLLARTRLDAALFSVAAEHDATLL